MTSRILNVYLYLALYIEIFIKMSLFDSRLEQVSNVAEREVRYGTRAHVLWLCDHVSTQ